MDLDPETQKQLDDAGRRAAKGLTLSLVIGALAVLALLIWFMRMGGSVWG